MVQAYPYARLVAMIFDENTSQRERLERRALFTGPRTLVKFRVIQRAWLFFTSTRVSLDYAAFFYLAGAVHERFTGPLSA